MQDDFCIQLNLGKLFSVGCLRSCLETRNLLRWRPNCVLVSRRGQKLRRVVHYSPYFCPHRALQGHNRSATSKRRISKQLLSFRLRDLPKIPILGNLSHHQFHEWFRSKEHSTLELLPGRRLTFTLGNKPNSGPRSLLDLG